MNQWHQQLQRANTMFFSWECVDIWFRMELILLDKTIFKTITIIRNTNDSCSNAQGQACLNHDFCPIAWTHFVKCVFRIHLDTQQHIHLHIKYIKCNNCSYRISLNWNVKDTPSPVSFILSHLFNLNYLFVFNIYRIPKVINLASFLWYTQRD